MSISRGSAPNDIDVREGHYATYVIMCMFALANSASALYKGGQGSTRCLGVWKPLLAVGVGCFDIRIL